MITKEREQEPYILRNYNVEIPDTFLKDENTRNDKKHRESCMKARKKRKKEKKLSMGNKDDLIRTLFYILSLLTFISAMISLLMPFFWILTIILFGIDCVTVWFGAMNIDENRNIQIEDMIKNFFY